MEKVCFKTKKGPAALGPYSTATIYGGVIYLSGMIGVNPQTGKAPEGGTLAQAAQAFENIKTVLGELGADTADVLKTTVYLTNMADFGEVNKLYAEVFGPDYPARTCVEVSAADGAFHRGGVHRPRPVNHEKSVQGKNRPLVCFASDVCCKRGKRARFLFRLLRRRM